MSKLQGKFPINFKKIHLLQIKTRLQILKIFSPTYSLRIKSDRNVDTQFTFAISFNSSGLKSLSIKNKSYVSFDSFAGLLKGCI